ncbi:methyltransferase domain-containing protein [Kribbella sp. NPDC026611]|uniref:class I SAM-dependent methyltransferase n=1 Tax=Kribbella sp. NPDC026611 TaxID=3154911 RepID=UPI0033FFD75B
MEWFRDPGVVGRYRAAHEGWGPQARYYQSRIHLISASLQGRSGELLDVGCGPGVLIEHLLRTRPDDLRISACDISAEMLDTAAGKLADAGRTDQVSLSLASIEQLPYPAARFDVVIAAGVLEYVDLSRALPELARVVRADGLVIVTMLNPLSPYRLFEWCVYWPAVRLVGRVERLLGRPADQCHTIAASGIRAKSHRRLTRLLGAAGLEEIDAAYYDVNALLPPLDGYVRRWTRRWRDRPDTTISRGARRWLGTAYLIAARPATT